MSNINSNLHVLNQDLNGLDRIDSRRFSYPMITNQDIINFTLDLWVETGLLTKTGHAQGNFYTTQIFPMQIFNFYVPADDQVAITQQSMQEINAFYKARNFEPMIYGSENVLKAVPARPGEILMNEVIMRADIAAVLQTLPEQAAAGLTLTRTSDFTAPANFTAYNEAFLSPDKQSEYDKIYLGFPTAYQNALHNGASFTPWMLKGEKDGDVVCSVTMLHRRDLVGLYNLATRPACCGQGLAKNVIREALSIAASEGAKTVYLVTDNDSDLERTYARMGFQPIARYKALTFT